MAGGAASVRQKKTVRFRGGDDEEQMYDLYYVPYNNETRCHRFYRHNRLYIIAAAMAGIVAVIIVLVFVVIATSPLALMPAFT
eukprot:CAMPEP_0198331802 /NCGR_PEP_ID=MMETSP1450-20131203/17845_1 /TAXON_ID=753684 ORGANISM="Madagascaria erythrocladiodes, Strain CCMP3234" /NCGR_SAMPLE_ID=MMETSP1450 /ASSEMBLY_ACC=CAM_ASM_001115 /LENGTH=82 /DNA_ID=CAMNT_0044036215 /DNA_START=75 /DNA_END=320 /DNA_ORIENTATION=+